MEYDLLASRRLAGAATLVANFGDERVEAHFEPHATFLMRGLGYGHPDWGHGTWHGALQVEREDLATEALPGRLDHVHVQAPSRVTLTTANRVAQGFGVLEQMIIGAYSPLGLTGIVDG